MMQEHSADVHELFSRILGDPQTNLDEAVETFVQEFETKRDQLPGKDVATLLNLQQTPARLACAKEDLEMGLEDTSTKARMTRERLELLRQSVMEESNQQAKAANPTQLAKEAFQKDIDEAREAFDQEMALRHEDVVKQYVGAFVQHIDHY